MLKNIIGGIMTALGLNLSVLFFVILHGLPQEMSDDQFRKIVWLGLIGFMLLFTGIVTVTTRPKK